MVLYFWTATLGAKKLWESHQNSKGNYFQPRILYPTKLSIKYESIIMPFLDNQGLKKFISYALFSGSY